MNVNPTMSDRLPPHSIEAEQGVIGCLLEAPQESLTQCAERKVLPEWFYDLRHAELWRAISELADDGKPVDGITLAEWLKQRGKVEAVGGLDYALGLRDVLPSAAHLPAYLDLLRGQWLLRRLLGITARTQAALWEWTGDPEEFVLTTEAQISQLTEESAAVQAEHPMKEVMGGVIDDMEEHRMVRGQTQLRGLPLGKKGWHLDKIVRGVRENYYVVLAARPGDGKTSFAMNVVEHLALDYEWSERTGLTVKNSSGEDVPETRIRKGVPVAVFSLEMDEQSLGYRMLFGRADVDMAMWSEGFPRKGADEALVAASKQLCKAPIYIDSTPGQTIGQIAAKARRMVKQYGIKLFVLDYLQLVELENSTGMDRVKELTKVSRKIMALGKQLKVPWLVLAQMNRNIETADVRRPPLMSDLKDCGSIEQDAHVVIMLHKPDLKRRKKDDPPTDEELIEQATIGEDWSRKPKRLDAYVVKNRHGPTGHAQLVFKKNLCQIEDWHLWKVAKGLEDMKKGESNRLLPLDSE